MDSQAREMGQGRKEPGKVLSSLRGLEKGELVGREVGPRKSADCFIQGLPRECLSGTEAVTVGWSGCVCVGGPPAASKRAIWGKQRKLLCVNLVPCLHSQLPVSSHGRPLGPCSTQGRGNTLQQLEGMN